MNPELQRIYDSVPEDAPKSRLEPYRELILRWRRQGRSYRKIQQMLRDECHTPVATMTLHEFVKLRAKPRKPAEPEIEPATVQLAQSSSSAVSSVERKPRKTFEERRAQADAIRDQFANKPGSQPMDETRPLFDYDPDKPLTLISTKEK